ncbi:uncharacterized protein [Tenebrio molitor]|uniref:uncharacterized protein isoform X3 n=1 Tax=Tenebrio molitor TaxID=7067 RepID=UPI0036248F1F
MSSIEDILYAFSVLVICILCMFFTRLCCRSRCMKRRRKNQIRSRIRNEIMFPNQQEDIYNISSRVQGQGQWPTHDAHVSLDNFAITNELNKYNDDPPTYEEAMSIATSINNNTVVPAVVPKTTITPTSTTATSTSN